VFQFEDEVLVIECGGHVNKDVNWLGKRGAALDVVVADQTEGSSLGKDCSVIVNRAIAEAEEEPRGDAIAVNGLGHVPGSNALAVDGFEGDKAARRALRVANGNEVSAKVRHKYKACEHHRL